MTPLIVALFSVSLSFAPMITELEQIAQKYAIPASVFISIAVCESNLNPTVSVIDTNGKRSTGIFQFQNATWNAYGEGSIKNWRSQAHTAAQMMKDGEYWHWKNCHKKVMKMIQEYAVTEAS